MTTTATALFATIATILFMLILDRSVHHITLDGGVDILGMNEQCGHGRKYGHGRSDYLSSTGGSDWASFGNKSHLAPPQLPKGDDGHRVMEIEHVAPSAPQNAAGAGDEAHDPRTCHTLRDRHHRSRRLSSQSSFATPTSHHDRTAPDSRPPSLPKGGGVWGGQGSQVRTTFFICMETVSKPFS